MSETSAVAETAARIFADLGDPQTLTKAKDESWRKPLWQALEEAGLTQAWTPDTLGGTGAEMADGFAVLDAAGRAACPVPLGETLAAGWLLARAGITVPAGVLTVAPARPNDRITLDPRSGKLSGRARAVPFAREAGHIAVLAEKTSGGAAIALVPVSSVKIEKGVSVAGEPADTVTFDGAVPATLADAPAGVDAEALALMGATIRSVMMAGALAAVLDMTVAYSGERVAFERKISKFQAVQQNLARLAGEVAAALAASGSAAATIAEATTFDATVLLEAAAAKIRVGEAVNEGAAIAHQVYGAIGFTTEHRLHRYTKRLWAWRDQFGSEAQWAVRLGNHVARQGADEIWPMLAAR